MAHSDYYTTLHTLNNVNIFSRKLEFNHSEEKQEEIVSDNERLEAEMLKMLDSSDDEDKDDFEIPIIKKRYSF